MKAANTERLKIPPTTDHKGGVDTTKQQPKEGDTNIPLNTQEKKKTGTEITLTNPTIDPEVLLDAASELPTEGNPEGTSHEESYILEDEQEGETLSGTKEMRA